MIWLIIKRGPQWRKEVAERKEAKERAAEAVEASQQSMHQRISSDDEKAKIER